MGGDQISEQLLTAVSSARRGRVAADQLMQSLRQTLKVDGAAMTVDPADGALGKSLAGSGPLSSELIEVQFMLGEGPCIRAGTSGAAVLAPDLRGAEAQEWPHFVEAASALGVAAVFAFPVTVGGLPMGALLLYRNRPGPLSIAELTGAYFAAELAALPILDVAGLTAAGDDDTSAGWADLAALTRSEIYQAAGVLIAQLGISPTAALVRLRAHAFVHGKTTRQTAYDILAHRVQLGDDDFSAAAEPEDQR